MRVLLTGGTGFVGAHTAAALLDAGHDVRVLVRDPKRLANVAALGVDVAALDVAVGDMTDETATAAAASGMDAVIHAAAAVGALNRADAHRTVESNVRGTQVVLTAALAAGCDPVVHVSSVAAVFSTRAPLVHANLPPATGSASPYTKSKALAEEFARSLQAEGRPIVIVYPGGVVGPSAGSAFGDVAEGFISILRTGFLALDDGAFGVLDVRDLARVLVAALRPGHGPARFMTGGRLVTLPEIAALLRGVTGRRLPVLPTPGVVFRSLGRAVDVVRRVVPIDTVFTAEAMDLLTLARPTDDESVHTDLGVPYRDVADTIEAAVRSLYAAGKLTPRQAGTVARTDPVRG